MKYLLKGAAQAVLEGTTVTVSLAGWPAVAAIAVVGAVVIGLELITRGEPAPAE